MSALQDELAPREIIFSTRGRSQQNQRISCTKLRKLQTSAKKHGIWLKGTVSRDFLLLVFSWISFPQDPEYTIRAVSNFFENSWRYSQLKVDHRYQRRRRQFLPPVSLVLLIPVTNLPPVSLTPVVNFELGISPRIFEKVRNGPNGILWGWGETDWWKKPEAKNLVTLSL